MTPFPETPLYKKLQKEQRLLSDKFWDSCTLFDLNFAPAQMTARQLEEGFLGLLTDVYSKSATDLRKKIFKNCVKQKKGLRRSSQKALTLRCAVL